MPDLRKASGMIAKDVMCARVITIGAHESIRDAAQKLVQYRISALPVVDSAGKLVGMISEGDLLRRFEIGTDRKRRSWWLRLMTRDSILASDFVRTHGLTVAEVMSSPAISVSPDTSLNEIAQMMEEKRIKRVPVIWGNTLVGIVSRADLVRAVAMRSHNPNKSITVSDDDIRDELLFRIESEPCFQHTSVSVSVSEGVVELTGHVQVSDEIAALRVAAEGVPGVRAVNSNVHTSPDWMWGY